MGINRAAFWCPFGDGRGGPPREKINAFDHFGLFGAVNVRATWLSGPLKSAKDSHGRKRTQPGPITPANRPSANPRTRSCRLLHLTEPRPAHAFGESLRMFNQEILKHVNSCVAASPAYRFLKQGSLFERPS